MKLIRLILLISSVSAIYNSQDSSTYSNIDEVVSSHLSLDIIVDFNRKVFEGVTIITMKTIKDNVSSVFFDSVGMSVSQVDYMHQHEGCNIWTQVSFNVSTPNTNLGNSIEVFLPYTHTKDQNFFIRFYYETNDQSTAISWLNPEQTAGKKLPYLYTQCEDIACRSLSPMQDTPAVRITYDANIKVPNDFVVKMSANQTSEKQFNSTFKSFQFENKIKMPSYLIAIAIGDLEYRSLGNRVGVITEPINMDKVANELSSLQTLFDTVESYITPYIWGNYSIIILPPSFPMGGMENPLLTFASPTIITGDKSQVDVATHEIAHSWTGNQVTCNNWSNFWLNEGFTVFQERKATSQIHNKDFSMEAAYLGNISMYSDIQSYGLNNSYSSLYPIINNDKPDNSFSEIPYEKGFQLLYYLEQLISEQKMQQWLRSYVSLFSLQSITYELFQQSFTEFVQTNFTQEDAQNILKQIDWNSWIKGPGLAPVHLDFTTAKLNESSQLAQAYIDLGGTSSPQNYQDYLNYSSNLKVVFHEKLNQQIDKVNIQILQRIDNDFNVTLTLDPEVKQRWFPLGIKKNYTPVFDQSHQFISSQGRLKYLTPIYKALLDDNKNSTAVNWFCQNINFYHPLAVSQISQLLGLQSKNQIQMCNEYMNSFNQSQFESSKSNLIMKKIIENIYKLYK